MEHIDAAVMFYIIVDNFHAVSARNILRGQIGVPNYGEYRFGLQRLERICFAGAGSFDRVTPMPKGFLEQIANFQYLFAFPILQS